MRRVNVLDLELVPAASPLPPPSPPGGSRNLFNWVHPLSLTCCVAFLFPDRDLCFQRVDQPTPRLEGIVPMRAADDDRDARFGKRHDAKPVDDRTLDERPA